MLNISPLRRGFSFVSMLECLMSGAEQTYRRDVPDGWPLTAPLFLEAFENEVEMLLYGIVSLDAWTAALRLG